MEKLLRDGIESKLHLFDGIHSQNSILRQTGTYQSIDISRKFHCLNLQSSLAKDFKRFLICTSHRIWRRGQRRDRFELTVELLRDDGDGGTGWGGTPVSLNDA